MCKLNINCTKSDGECTCQPKDLAFSSAPSQSNLLCSILAYIQTQPEIIAALSESSALPPSLVTPSPTSSTKDAKSAEDLSPQIDLISEIPSMIYTKKPFSLMFETINSSLIKPDLEEIEYKVSLISSSSEVLEELGSLKGKGVLLFRKLVVKKPVKQAFLLIEAEKKYNIKSLKKSVKIKSRKSKENITEA